MMRRLSVILLPLLLITARLPAQTNNVTVGPEVEEVIRGSLKYLASQQKPNGSWSVNGSHPIALTGYVLMSFLATGNLPNEGAYSRNVASGVRYLLEAVQSNGMFEPENDGQYMYGHGIATIALAEVYGQTKAESIRPKLEKLVKLILSSQNKQGGWRYRPTSQDSDISVTVLQVVALRAAKNAGLDVPQETLSNAVSFVRHCYQERAGGFGYQPGGGPGFARTSAAIYSLQVCGEYDDPRVKKGSEYLSAHSDSREWFAYGHFYAGPAQYMVGGKTWDDWYTHVRELLVKHVQRKGEFTLWDAELDRGQGTAGLAPIYHTAVYTTILALPYHYVPLYQR